MSLEQVAHAKVHLVQPEESPFVRDEKPVTASVVIKTKPGATLNRRNIAGIVALVSGAVKGLSADNITVVGSDGQVLSDKPTSNLGAASSDQLSYQRDVESHLASQAQEILMRLLGPGRALVRVTADMSFRHLTETSEKFDPEGKVIKKESITSSKVTAPPGTRGPAGAISNIPPGQAAVPSGAGPNQNEEAIDNEYAVSKVNRVLKEQQGVIDRLTIAVMLIPTPAGPDTPPEEALGITPADAKELVKQAVGYKEGRDQIQVSIGKVAEAPASEAAFDAGFLAMQQWQNYAAIVRASSLGVAAFALLAIGLVAFRRRPVPVDPGLASSSLSPEGDDLTDLQAVAATIKAWLEEPATIRLDRDSKTSNSRAKPA
jgi:flagellar M-ring protein FliF